MDEKLGDMLGTLKEGLLLGRSSEGNFTSEYQLRNLGLSLGDLAGKKVLDLGCGSEGNLVKAIIEYGGDADGIDPDAPDGRNFIKQEIASIYPFGGCIPRDCNHYNFITAHSFPPFNMIFSDWGEMCRKVNILSDPEDSNHVREVDSDLKADCVAGYIAMSEALRVLRRGGKIICSPHLNRLEENMIVGYDYTIEKKSSQGMVRLAEAMDAAIERLSQQIPAFREVFAELGFKDGESPDFFKYVTVIHKY